MGKKMARWWSRLGGETDIHVASPRFITSIATAQP